MFQEMYAVIGDDFLPIPPGDITGEAIEDTRRGEFPQYAEIVSRINRKIGRTTMNSLKKNFFVDFSRAGFIERFGKDKNILDPNIRSHVYFVKLTGDAVELIKTDRITDRYYLFSRGIDSLFGDFISHLANAIYNSNYSNDSISYTEFQYILSDIKKSGEEKISLLDSYRELEDHQKIEVHTLLKEYCTPERFEGDRTVQRDYDNWRNETQQIMLLLRNTLYFDVRENNFSLNRGKFGIFPETTRQPRQLGVRQEYFNEHQQERRPGFDLHHIIPIKFVRNKGEFALIDNYRNLIYIQRDIHQRIKDNHLLLCINSGVVTFQDIYARLDDVEATNNLSAMYKESLAKGMMDYNATLLKERFGWVR